MQEDAMSNEPIVAHGSIPDSSIIDARTLGEQYDIIGKDKDGVILVRRKWNPDTDSKKQKAADGLAAIFGLFF
jgi:hypothetical protein